MDEDVFGTHGHDLGPAEQLALIEAQERAVARSVDVDPRLLFGAWGTAWLVGFLLFALGHDGRADGGSAPLLDVPTGVSGPVLGVLLLSAAVLTAVHAARSGRGISGPSTFTGIVYGWTWALGFAGLAAVNTAVLRAADDPSLAALLWPATSGLLVGVLYLAGAAVWREKFQFGLGVWILFVTCTGALLGLPALYWILALAGGGGFLLAAGWFALRGWTRS